MPDSTINYKVKIDASSVAEQLAQIKSQIDFAVNQSLATPMNSLGGTFNSTNQILQNGTASFMNAATAGFQKFSNDFTQQSAQSASNYSMSGARLGFNAITGWGYDANDRTTNMGRFQREAREAFSDRSIEMGMGAIDFAAGATGVGYLGAHFLGASAVTTAGLGVAAGVFGAASLGIGLGMGTFGYDVNASMRGRAFMRDSSWKFASGRFSNADASRVGVDISNIGRSSEFVGYDLSQNEAMGMVQQYSEMGGYDSMRTAEEFRTRTKNMIKGVLDLQRIVGATQEEAMQMMKQATSFGLVTDSTSGTSLALNMQASAYRAGYSATALNAFGMQASEMVRGTGMNMGLAYLGGMDTLADIRAMRRNGSISTELMNQLGSAESAAQRMIRSGLEYGMSDMGLAYLQTGASNPESAIRGAVGGMRTVSDYLSAAGGQGRRASEAGGEALYKIKLASYLDMFERAKRSDPNLDFNNIDTWSGFVQAASGGEVTDTDARLMHSMGMNILRGGGGARAGAEAAERLRLRAENRTGAFAQLWDDTGNAAARLFRTQEVAEVATDVGNSVDRTLDSWGRSWDRIGGGATLALSFALGPVAGYLVGKEKYGKEAPLNIGVAKYDVGDIGAGLAQIAKRTPTGGSATNVAGEAAYQALSFKTEELYDIQGKMSAAGLKPFSNGTPEQQFKKAGQEYDELSARAATGDERALAITSTLDRGQYIAGNMSVVGTAGAANRAYLETVKQKPAGQSNPILAFEKIKETWDTAGNDWVNQNAGYSYYIGRAKITPSVATDVMSALSISETEGSSKYEQLITKLNTMSPSDLRKQFLAVAKGGTDTERQDYVEKMVLAANSFKTSSQVLTTETMLARLTKDEDGRNFVTLAAKNANISLDPSQIKNTQYLAEKLLNGGNPGLIEQLSKFAGNSDVVSDDQRKTMMKQQELLQENMLGIDSRISGQLQGMGVTDNTATAAQVQVAQNRLMVEAMSLIAKSISANGTQPYMNVKNVDD